MLKSPATWSGLAMATLSVVLCCSAAGRKVVAGDIPEIDQQRIKTIAALLPAKPKGFGAHHH